MGCVRGWIKWNTTNGERVTWGSSERLQFFLPVTVHELELLAHSIGDSVLREYRVKPREHEYRFAIFCEAGAPAFQGADTSQEAWAALFKATGRVDIFDRLNNNETVVTGQADEVAKWLKDTQLEDLVITDGRDEEEG